jgi:4-amino-4-deoxy-L-arabinose transferase-like glycosyltransferase
MKIKVMNFLKSKSDLIIVLVLLFALILRLKYLTINQAVWYDEADYLSIAKSWAFGLNYDFPSIRPVLLPFIEAIFFKIGLLSELPLRVLELLISLAGVYLMYLLGKELFSRPVGWIASFLLSIFYLHLFFTARILTDVPSTTLWTLIAYLFWKGYEGDSNKYLYFTAIALGLGILLRFPLGLFVFLFLIYLLLTTGLKFLKKKQIWISGIIGALVLLPYFIWFYIKFNSLAIFSTSGFYDYVNLFSGYYKLIPDYFYSPFQILWVFFLIGLALILFKLITKFKLIRTNENVKKTLYLFLLFLTPLIYFGISDHVEARYMLPVFPAVFIIVGFALVKFYKITDRYLPSMSFISIVLIIAILVSSAFYQVGRADDQINLRKDSYIQFKQAGQWVKENSQPSDKIIASGIPQLTYYTDREIIYWPPQEEFEELIKNKEIQFIILSALEGSPDWSYTWPEKHQDKVTPVHVLVDPNKKPVLVVYELS